MRQRASASLYKLCLPDASMHWHNDMCHDAKAPHATACLSIAVRMPEAPYVVCQVVKAPHATVCLSIAVYELHLPDASQHNMHNDMCHVAEVATCYSVPQHR